IKLGPGVDRGLIPSDAEAQWVSVDHEVVELAVWFGAVARPGIRRAALVLGAHGSAELTGADDSEDVESGTLQEYLYEPDGAVIRARLIGTLARQLDATMLSTGIAYLSAATAVETPFASCFRILETFPFDEKLLRRELTARKIGTLEIKKRGADVDPAQLRKKLALKGPEKATLIVTRVAGRHVALLTERVQFSANRR
ncbi:MAG: SAM-dependent methyltransferase, partial [Lacisediminihabitans sp.]